MAGTVNPTDPAAEASPVCIVGAGQAGCELALALREQGWTGAIVLFGEEQHLPYQRPPLSKAYLHGAVETQSLYLRKQAIYERAGVELVLNCGVERLDPRSRTVTLASGVERSYTKLALATGGRPRKLALADAQRAERTGDLYYLRTIEDAARIRQRLHPGERLVIVGGGYVGLEVASAAIARGLSVTVVEALPRLLARVTSPEVSAVIESVHRDAGVDVRTGAHVSGFEFDASGSRIVGVRCRDGLIVPADLVVVGIGLVPNVELAQAAGLLVDSGIVVDEYARTSEPNIVAAGDCTSYPSLWSRSRTRLESVFNAVEQARTAAATLVGKQRPHHAVPWFWSDQHAVKLQIAGLSEGYDQLVVRGSLQSRSFAAFYLRAGEIIACDALNRPAEFVTAKRLVASRACIDPQALATASIPLQDLAARDGLPS